MKRKLSLFLLLVLLVSALVLPAHGAELGYVTDAAELLSYGEWEELEALCAGISQKHGCGVYIITVDDYTDFGDGDVFQTTYELYHDYQLGEGTDRNGLVLLLSMAERDYALFVYGGEAEYAFDGYGQIQLEEQFLPEFGENNWYGGFRAYARTCGEYLDRAAAGDPVRESPLIYIGMFAAGSFLVALLVVSILKRGMKNVKKQAQASAYLSGQLDLTGRHDQFTHKTETRRKIESSSGSSSRSGGGGSGRSGKF